MINSANDRTERVFPRTVLHKDVVVVGAGTAGICAAIAAARNGAKTALVTDRPVLGGSASSEVRVTPSGADSAHWNRYARETGIMEELSMRVMAKAHESGKWRWLHYDDVAFDMCYGEPNLEVFLNTTVYNVHKKNDASIQSVEAVQLRSEKVLIIEGKVFIDCSGDGVVGFLSGAEYRIGREAKSEFNEMFAPEVADRGTMGATLLFSSIDRGHPVKYKAPAWALNTRDLSTIVNLDHVAARSLYRFPDGTYYGFWWAEYGGIIDSIHDDDKVMRHCREIVYGLWDYIKNSGRFKDVENQDIDWVGYLPGKRESRRLMGDYICTSHDFLAQKKFDDAIGFTGWPIDIHPPKGYRDPLPACTHEHTPGITDIPFRSIYSRNIDNLLFAGRNVSVSHEGLGTLRVIATTAVMGEAAGTAAALCSSRGITPRDIYKNEMKDFQRLLVRNDQSIAGYRLVEKNDISRTATVSASSELALERAEGNEWHNCNEPIGLIVPVATEMLETISLFLKPLDTKDVEIAVFGVDKPENYRLQNLIVSQTMKCDHEGWYDIAVNKNIGTGKKVIVVVKQARNVLVKCWSGRMTGVLGITFKPESKYQFDSWFNLIDYAPCFRLSPGQHVYAASNINNGYIRHHGTPNLWASAPMKRGRSEWIEYRFAKPEKILSVELVFNTNINIRRAYYHRVFEETIRDYDIEVLTDNGWQSVHAEADNIFRFRRHAITPVTAQAIRLSVHATWGHPTAEVFDMRVYGTK
ncbi:MAG: FAD-dependent oxidoreductase [Spirochaetes bacterium]|nr:FAD-dependent oxidoreductase [Spirochaetota bacterium]